MVCVCFIRLLFRLIVCSWLGLLISVWKCLVVVVCNMLLLGNILCYLMVVSVFSWVGF